MKTPLSSARLVREHRKNLKGLIGEIRRRPLDLLPERSVACLSQFLSGFEILGPPLRRDLWSFQDWLKKRLFYPDDTGTSWPRFIQLNSNDDCDGFEMCLKLYSEYAQEDPVDLHPTVQEVGIASAKFDFYLYLYAIGRRPGLYLGSGESVHLLAAHLAGYFRGKRAVGDKLTADEREFVRFNGWMCGNMKLPRRYPWYTVVKMWPYAGLNSLECFFAYYDAYLTDFGKRPRGLEDLFEAVTDRHCTTYRRRKKLPAKIVSAPGNKWWWWRRSQNSSR